MFLRLLRLSGGPFLLALIAAWSAILVGAVSVVAGYLHRRFFVKPAVAVKFGWFRRALVIAGLLELLCLAYAHFVEPYWLATRCLTIASAKLPPSCRPIRIVHISDLHSDPQPRLEEKLPVAVAKLNPDVICFTGDAANSVEGLPHFRRCMTRLSASAPTYAVRGNWDTRTASAALFGDTGVTELDGQGVTLTIAGGKLWISGLPAYAQDRIPSALKAKPTDAFCVFLHHYPDAILEFTKRDVDLVLSGHTHGGQVALPLYGAVITLSRFGKDFEGGLFRLGDTWLHVSRGVGMEGRFAPRLRFLVRPEITLIEVCPQEPNNR